MNKSAMPKSKAKTAYGLLSEIRKLILAEPQRYDQKNWSWLGEELPSNRRPACGTVCCVAGWVSALKFKKQITKVESATFALSDSKVFKRAKSVLGLTYEATLELTHPNAAGDRNAQTVEEHARHGAAHIAKFQQKYAKQLKAKRV